MNKNQQPLNDLLSISTPQEWKDFVFQTQTTLIESGFVEMLTEQGRSEFTARMQGLYNFFGKLPDPGPGNS